MLIPELATGILVDGAPASGALVTFYRPGTLTKRTVFQSERTADNPNPETHPNPLTLDADGRAYAYSTLRVRMIVRTSGGSIIMDVNPIDPTLTDDQVGLSDTTQDRFTGTTVAAALQAISDSIGQPTSATDYGIDGLLTVPGGIGRAFYAAAADIINVKNYGAVGDGSTNDTTDITTAITKVTSTGGCLYFPAGTYVVSSALTFASFTNLMVAGDGPRSIIRQSGSAFAVLDMTSCTTVTVSQLQLQGGGTAASTGAIGIQWDSGSKDISIESVRFDGIDSPSPVGFNVGISGAGSSTTILNCRFTRIYGNLTTGAAGVGAYLNTVTRVTVDACDFILDVNGSGTPTANIGLSMTSCERFKVTDVSVDYAGTYGVKLSSCSHGVLGECIVQNTTTGALGDGKTGFYVSAGLDVELAACKSYSNGRHGAAFLAACNRCKVTGGNYDSNTNSGLYVGDTSTNMTLGGSVSVYGNTDHGVEYASTSTASADAHKGSVIGPLFAAGCGKSGVYLTNTSYSLLTGVRVKDCSVTSTRTYPAIDITTYYTGATHYGGRSIVLNGCAVQETPDTQEHLAALRLKDGNNTVAGLLTTRVVKCDFPAQCAGSGGTPCSVMEVAVVAANFVDHAGNLGLTLAGNITVSGILDLTILVDTSGGTRRITFPASATVAGTRIRAIATSTSNTMELFIVGSFIMSNTAYTLLTSDSIGGNAEVVCGSGGAWTVTGILGSALVPSGWTAA